MPLPKAKVAFVTGINGISGNAIVEHLIRQPKSEWSKIIVTSRSPLKSYWQDYRVEFVAIDFLDPVESVIEKIQPYCSDVTHAYFTSYVHNDNFDILKEKNIPLFQTFLTAIDTVAGESLQRVCLQTGGKNYGVEKGPLFAPTSEEHTPRSKDPLNFYHPQEDFMFALQKKRKWGYNVIRPQSIIGFTPGHSGMTAALKLVQYLIICRETGETPKFPANELFYKFVDDCSYAVSIADLTVYATTTEQCKDEAFNHTNGDAYSWQYFYPRLGKYFGVHVPEELEWTQKGEWNGVALEFSLADWAKDKRPVWNEICEKYGGEPEAFDWGSWAYFDWATSRNWLSLMSTTKARKFGWTRYDDSYDAWIETVRTFENARVLPSQRQYDLKNGRGSSQTKVSQKISDVS